ncbi:lytic transglycosylase, partial [Streptomyces sp. NPDC056728]
MSKLSFSGHSPLTKTHKYSIAGIATLGAAALAFTLVPGNSTAEAETISAAPVAFEVAAGKPQIKDVHASVTNQMATADQQVKNAAAKLKATQVAATKRAADAAAAKAKVDAAAKAKVEKDRQVRDKRPDQA